MTQNNQLPIKRLIAKSINMINGPFDNVCRMKNVHFSGYRTFHPLYRNGSSNNKFQQ